MHDCWSSSDLVDVHPCQQCPGPDLGISMCWTLTFRSVWILDDLLASPSPAANVILEVSGFRARYKSVCQLVPAVRRQRVIEHNLLVVAKYYDHITFARLCELLDLSREEVQLRSLDASHPLPKYCLSLLVHGFHYHRGLSEASSI